MENNDETVLNCSGSFPTTDSDAIFDHVINQKFFKTVKMHNMN